MDQASGLQPASLAHIVFRTQNLHRMTEFWMSFLGAEIVFESDFIAFLRYDEEHHRVAIIQDENAAPRPSCSTGLHHVAFSYSSLRGLLQAYRTRLQQGIKPTWSVNHGPTTSIYYKDPDGNAIETQVDNFATVAEANAFMMSPLFQQNPIGTDVDPDKMLSRLDAGVSEAALKEREEIGARTSVPAAV